LTKRKRTKDRVEDSIPGRRWPTGERSSCQWGLTGPFVPDRAGRALPGGLWAGELGKGDLSAQNLNRTSEGGSLEIQH
jgi:hypothetical protein